MCGRYTLRHDMDEVAARFGVDEVQLPLDLLRPRFNIAPSQEIPAVLILDGAGDARPRRVLTALRWGLVPSWAKDPSIGNKLLNARAETLAEKPAFRTALQRRRCLIPADGFYEWQRQGRDKQPFFIHLRRAFREGDLFAFAGLWETWWPPGVRPSGGEPMRSGTIITVAPNGLMAPIHDRMPAILRPEDEAAWLAAAAGAPGTNLLRPYDEAQMGAEPVSRRVNSPRHDAPDCLAAPEPGSVDAATAPLVQDDDDEPLLRGLRGIGSGPRGRA